MNDANLLFGILGLTISAVSFLVAALALTHARGANFVAAWTSMVERLEQPSVRQGRGILRLLHAEFPGQPPERESWCKTLAEHSQAAKSDHFLSPLNEDLETVVRLAKAAYDEFDLAGIIVLHSRIPGLRDVFVAEYQDNIIACWEQGRCFLEDRIVEMLREKNASADHVPREELYHCFSILYILAKIRERAAPRSYPFYSWFDRLRLYRPHWVINRRARKVRDRAIREAFDHFTSLGPKQAVAGAEARKLTSAGT